MTEACYKLELEDLQNLYIEKLYETRELEDYIEELEHILLEHGLESSRMVKWRLECQRESKLF